MSSGTQISETNALFSADRDQRNKDESNDAGLGKDVMAAAEYEVYKVSRTAPDRQSIVMFVRVLYNPTVKIVTLKSVGL